MKPRFLLYAGPDGSGKSTLQRGGGPSRWDRKNHLDAVDLARDLARDHAIKVTKRFGIALEREHWERIILAGDRYPKFAHLVADAEVQVGGGVLSVSSAGDFAAVATLATELIRARLLEEQVSFSLESVLSHPTEVDMLEHFRTQGYSVELIYVTTVNPSINVWRVRARARQGGHSVPEGEIVSRYYRSLDLLLPAMLASDRAHLFDNSQETMLEVARWEEGELALLRKQLPYWVRSSILQHL